MAAQQDKTAGRIEEVVRKASRSRARVGEGGSYAAGWLGSIPERPRGGEMRP